MKEIEPFYLNIRLLNKADVVSNKVAEKVGTNVFARAAASVASRVVSDATVVSKFSDTLVEKIYMSVESMGIECELIKRFAQGPMVCFKVCITSVDQMQLVLAAKAQNSRLGSQRFSAVCLRWAFLKQRYRRLKLRSAKKYLWVCVPNSRS